MANYLCRLLDRNGQVTSELPVVASTDRKAITTARTVFKSHDQHGSFELWQGERRIALHCDVDEGKREAPPPRGRDRGAAPQHQFI